MFIIRQLGVETDAIRAVNEVPTPTGVARQPQAEVFFHRGFINGFLFLRLGLCNGLAPLLPKICGRNAKNHCFM